MSSKKPRVTLVWKDTSNKENKKLILLPSTWEDLKSKCKDLTGREVDTIELSEGGAQVDDIELINENDILIIKSVENQEDLLKAKLKDIQSQDGTKIPTITVESPTSGTSSDESRTNSSRAPSTGGHEDPRYRSGSGSQHTKGSGPNSMNELTSPSSGGSSNSSNTGSSISQIMSVMQLSAYPYANDFLGSMYFMGMYYLENPEVIEAYAQFIQATKPNVKHKEKYLESLILKTQSQPSSKIVTMMDLLILESAAIPANLPSALINVSCGPNSWAAVSASGEVYMDGPKQLHYQCLGRMGPRYDHQSGTINAYLVSGLDDHKIIGIKSGPFHSVAFSKDKCFTWGYNFNCSSLGLRGSENMKILQGKGKPTISSQLGRDHEKLYLSPSSVPQIEGEIISVSAGAAHSAALTTHGIYTWGLNDEGQLGHSDDPRYPNLVKSLLGKQVTRIACGAHHTLALLDNGWLFGWGWNSHGQLGFPTGSEVCVTVPKRVESLSGVEITEISCGNTFSAAISSGGSVWTWGSNNYGELGRKKGNAPQSLKIKDVIAVALDCGSDMCSIVSEEGDVYVWGRLAAEGFTNNQWEPRKLDSVHNRKLIARNVACGYTHMCILVDHTVTQTLQSLSSACLAESAVTVGDLKTALFSIQPLENLTSMINRIHSEMKLNKKIKNPAVRISTAVLRFSEKESSQKLTLQNLTTKTVTVSISIPSSDLPSGVFLETKTRSTDVKGGGSVNLSFSLKHSSKLSSTTGSIITINIERSGKKNKKYLSGCYIAFVISGSNGGKIDVNSSTQIEGALSKFRLKETTKPTALNLSNSEIIMFERLGGGGSGALVYRCTVNGYSCAVKILDLSETPADLVENFVKEIKLLENVEHPNIVKYLGSDQIGNSLRCFMEYYPFSLLSLIKSKPAGFSFLEATKISYEIAKGLAYLHTREPPIIHRDMKSGNILVALSEKDEIKIVKIVDFDASAITEFTRMNVTLVGTNGWMAPEIYTRQGYSVAADLWSYGMVIFEILSQKLPYWDCRPIEIPQRIVEGELPTMPKELPSEFTPLVSIMKSCLVVEPLRRPLASQLVQQLADLLPNNFK